ncbi:hypothetical protein RB195_006803 [Necator americanus]|uniref:Uncharacterized protein n=1 Tax=Necator americanus TaxID=51031 RepID=A0ABR1BXN8_NECAM
MKRKTSDTTCRLPLSAIVLRQLDEPQAPPSIYLLDRQAAASRRRSAEPSLRPYGPDQHSFVDSRDVALLDTHVTMRNIVFEWLFIYANKWVHTSYPHSCVIASLHT